MSESLSSGCRLYLLTPPVIPDPEPFVGRLEAAIQGGAIAALQIRLKVARGGAASDENICAVAERLLPVCRNNGIVLILNDRADLVEQTAADGVHLGAQDMPVKEARALLGDEAIIGASCQTSIHAAFEAGEQGADYVAFGAFYPSRTKRLKTRAGPELIRGWTDIAELPCVAIGGIQPQNAAPLIEAGADFLAVSSGVWAHREGPEQAVRQFHKAFEA